MQDPSREWRFERRHLTIGSSDRGARLRWAKEGIDDLDKLPSLDAGATPRRSTSSLDYLDRQCLMNREFCGGVLIEESLRFAALSIVGQRADTTTFGCTDAERADRGRRNVASRICVIAVLRSEISSLSVACASKYRVLRIAVLGVKLISEVERQLRYGYRAEI